MPDLEALNRDPTLDALEQQLVRDNPPTQRTYVGGSVIGQDCEKSPLVFVPLGVGKCF